MVAMTIDLTGEQIAVMRVDGYRIPNRSIVTQGVPVDGGSMAGSGCGRILVAQSLASASCSRRRDNHITFPPNRRRVRIQLRHGNDDARIELPSFRPG
jgi:hypothetical protein